MASGTAPSSDSGGPLSLRPKRKHRPSTRLASVREKVDEAARQTTNASKHAIKRKKLSNLTASFACVSPSSISSPSSPPDIAAARILLGVGAAEGVAAEVMGAEGLGADGQGAEGAGPDGVGVAIGAGVDALSALGAQWGSVPEGIVHGPCVLVPPALLPFNFLMLFSPDGLIGITDCTDLAERFGSEGAGLEGAMAEGAVAEGAVEPVVLELHDGTDLHLPVGNGITSAIWRTYSKQEMKAVSLHFGYSSISQFEEEYFHTASALVESEHENR